MNFLREKKLSQAASDLIQFDADSIRQVVSAQHSASPDVWLVDADSYENNGRLLRDSESHRMLAYSTKDRVLYATDGCNSCSRRVHASLQALPSGELQEFAEHNELRLELLEKLVGILNSAAETK
jgi:hypothetical protein